MISQSDKSDDSPREQGGCSRFCSRLPPVHLHLIFWMVFAFGLAADLWSKSAVFDWLVDTGRDGYAVIEGFLRLHLAQNSGAAFGIAKGQRSLLITASAVALAAAFVIFLIGGVNRKTAAVALGMFVAGVCGNLYDRLFNDGLVRDFIDVVYWPGKHWPAFNIADSMLCVSVGMLLLFGLATRTRKAYRKPAHPQK